MRWWYGAILTDAIVNKRLHVYTYIKCFNENFVHFLTT